MFGTGSYATIWKVENKGNYDVCQLSTQKKNKETGHMKPTLLNKEYVLSARHTAFTRKKNKKLKSRIAV